MFKKNCWLIFVLAIIIAAIFVSLGCKKQPAQQADTEDNRDKVEPSVTVAESPNKPAQPKPDIAAGTKAWTKMTLREIIAGARTWGPAFTDSVGKTATDFTLTDITGKQHKLSDYRGKNVLIIFWATWCGPCKAELPHLIALRNRIGQDELAMLAISYKTKYPPETTENVIEFVKQSKINYTVFSTDADSMPPPFSRVTGIPCSFFIDPQGKIKLATQGLLSLGEFKAILQAE